jgi:peptide/nickel transport system substrate-binding protein
MDPILSATNNDRELSMNTYDQLLVYKMIPGGDGTLVYDGLALAPALATSWKVDGPTVTFTLRQGVKFYPSGNPFTSADVKYTFDRALLATTLNGAFDLDLAGIYKPDQIKVLGPYTVSITFTDPKGNPKLLPGGLPTLRYPQYGIVDSKALEAHATSADPWAAKFLSMTTAGTGPYYVASRSPGQQTVLKANPTYWGGPPDFTTVVLRVVGQGDMAALLRGGAIQFASQGLAPTDYEALKSAGLTVAFQPTPQILRADLATDYQGLSDPRVRQAIAYAMPYDEILSVALKGRGERSYCFISPKTPGYVPAMSKYTTDPAKAKALMSAANVRGFSLPVYYDSTVPYNSDTVLLIQQALDSIGIRVDPEPQSDATFDTDYYGRGTGNNAQTGMALNTDAWWDEDAGSQTDAYVLKDSVVNWPRFDLPEIDSIYNKYAFDTDLTARTAAFVRIQKLVAEEVPFVPIALVGQVDAVATGITNLPFVVDSLNRFHYLKRV